MEELERLVEYSASEKKEAETLEFESMLDWVNFRIWRMDFRSGVLSHASGPTEAMIWISKSKSAKSVAELKRVVKHNHRSRVADTFRV